MNIRKRISDESGMSMAELLIYSLLLSLVLGIIGSLLISTLRTESTVRSVVDATTEAQLAARSIDTGIRNASAHTLLPQANNNQLVLARVAKGTEDISWACAAWYYTSSATGEGTIRYKESTDPIAVPADSSEVADWLLLAEGVQPITGLDIFSGSGDTLTMSFEVSAGPENPPASIQTSTIRRVTVWDSDTCF